MYIYMKHTTKKGGGGGGRLKGKCNCNNEYQAVMFSIWPSEFSLVIVSFCILLNDLLSHSNFYSCDLSEAFSYSFRTEGLF